MVQAMYLSMGQRHDYRTPLRAVQAPVLVVHGSDDLQPEAASRRYAELFPNARFAVLPGAGHFAYHDQPAAFATVTQDFLARALDHAVSAEGR
jgi:pimeloyl-ACP methyl ester carboxylesterase